ncbi:MAG: hypothetical protein AAF804_19150 [Bacteroidota bacterium]
MRNLFILWLFIVPYWLMGQDYQLMVPHRTYLFAPRGNRTIHLDSVANTPNGYRYYNYEKVDHCGSYPLSPLAPRIMQVAVSFDTLNRRYHWQNIAGDSLTWPLQTQSGDRWRMTGYRDSLWLMIQHDSTTWSRFLGSQDSIRHYHVSVRDDQDRLVTDTLNGLALQLSQSHGWVSSFSYDGFPQNGNLFPLEGVSNPNLGRQVLTEWDFYDMPLGGEIHYEEVQVWEGVRPHEGLLEFDRRMRWLILGREESSDHRRLTIDRTQAGSDYAWDVEEDENGHPRFKGIDTLYFYQQ